jgi:hypothetical protein
MWLGQLFYPWGFILQALALIHFFRRRPDGYWFFIIFFFGALGAIIYFFAEVLPDAGLLRDSFQRAGRRRRLAQLDAIVKENAAIGNVEELADLCLEQGQYARARELYDRVLASPHVSSLDPYYRRGVAALELGDAAAAADDIAHVVAEEPKYDFGRAIGLLAHAYAQSGQVEKADASFKRATDVSTLSETYYNYAQFLASQNRNDEAQQWLQRILDNKATMPRFARRRDRPWFRRAAALKKRIGG